MKYSKENPPRPEKPGSMDDPIFAAVHLTNMGWCDALGVSQHCSYATASYHATKVMAEIADLRQKLDSATETIKTLEFHLSEAKRDQDAILRLHDGLKHWGVEWSGSSCDAAVTELARMHAIFKAQGERHAKRCEEWAKTADEEREAKESALLQLSEAKDLLRKVEDQGVFHSCGSDLWPDGKMKCPECEAGLEGQILKLLGASIENRVDVPECGNCGGDLVRKTEPTWICPKCEL